MRKLFLTCVGNRDPYWLQAEGAMLTFSELKRRYGDQLPPETAQGPILSFFQKARPDPEDQIWLFYTAPGGKVRGATEDGALATQSALVEQCQLRSGQVKLAPLNDPRRHPDFDPSDYAMVISRMREWGQRVVRESGEEVDIRVIYSSGTPQMQAAWLLLTNSGLIPARLFRAEGDEVEIEPLFEDQLLTEACRLVRIGAFRAASDVFHNLEKRARSEVSEISRDRRGLFRMLSEASEAYYWWSTFEYRSAHRQLSETAKTLARFVERKQAASPSFHSAPLEQLQSLLSQQVEVLGRLAADEPIPRLRDLFVNARWHYEQGRYVEAIWRLDTLCELATVTRALHALEERWHVMLEAAYFSDRVSEHHVSLGDFIQEVYEGQAQSIPYHLTDEGAAWILKRLAPQLSSLLDSESRRRLQGMRNRVVHRASPIERNDVYWALGEVRRYVEGLWGQGVISEETSPFSLECIRQLAELFQQIGSGRI